MNSPTKPPKISVVTVVYNNVFHIQKTILSVLEQTYPNLEYIIIDGGSTDGTLEIIKKYENRLAQFVSEPDKGIYDAMNKGARLVSGDYINFMNSGDTFHSPQVVEDVAGKLQEESVEMLYGAAKFVYADYAVIYNPPFKKVKKSYAPCHQAAFAKTNILKEFGYFNTTYCLSADLDFFARFYSQGFKWVQSDIVIADFLAGGVSADKSKLYKEQYDILKRHFGGLPAFRLFLSKIVCEQGIKKILTRLGFPSILAVLVRFNNQQKGS